MCACFDWLDGHITALAWIGGSALHVAPQVWLCNQPTFCCVDDWCCTQLLHFCPARENLSWAHNQAHVTNLARSCDHAPLLAWLLLTCPLLIAYAILCCLFSVVLPLLLVPLRLFQPTPPTSGAGHIMRHQMQTEQGAAVPVEGVWSCIMAV
jgi:hypothetical protein